MSLSAWHPFVPRCTSDKNRARNLRITGPLLLLCFIEGKNNENPSQNNDIGHKHMTEQIAAVVCVARTRALSQKCQPPVTLRCSHSQQGIVADESMRSGERDGATRTPRPHWRMHRFGRHFCISRHAVAGPEVVEPLLSLSVGCRSRLG